MEWKVFSTHFCLYCIHPFTHCTTESFIPIQLFGAECLTEGHFHVEYVGLGSVTITDSFTQNPKDLDSKPNLCFRIRTLVRLEPLLELCLHPSTTGNRKVSCARCTGKYLIEANTLFVPLNPSLSQVYQQVQDRQTYLVFLLLNNSRFSSARWDYLN